MALPLRAALRSAGRFMVKNPATMFNIARHALGLKIAVPLDAMRWFISNTPPGKKAPQDVTVMARPPAISVGATVDLMGTTVRASASIRIDELHLGSDQLKVKVRLNSVDLKVLGESFTPVAASSDVPTKSRTFSRRPTSFSAPSRPVMPWAAATGARLGRYRAISEPSNFPPAPPAAMMSKKRFASFAARPNDRRAASQLLTTSRPFAPMPCVALARMSRSELISGKPAPVSA